jgi:hypothetical protein
MGHLQRNVNAGARHHAAQAALTGAFLDFSAEHAGDANFLTSRPHSIRRARDRPKECRRSLEFPLLLSPLVVLFSDGGASNSSVLPTASAGFA